MDFFERLRAAIGPKAQDGVHLAPIEPKKLANAQKWASFGGETPLLLLDNSVMSSGKAGVLVTSHALYADEPRLRLELGWLRHPPAYPDGPGGDVRVSTPQGDATLRAMLDDEAQGALSRVLSAIVAINNGQGPASTMPVEGPIGELAMRHLVHRDVLLAPAIPPKKLQHAAADFADWIDHASGERPIAFLDETALGKGDEGLLLTDRRLLAHVGERDWQVPYGAIGAVSGAKGFLEKKLVIDAGPCSAQIPLVTCGDAVEPVATFLRGVAQLPHDRRWAPPPGFASEADPTGASALASSFAAPDPRVLLMLRYVHAAVAAQWMPVAMGQDLVARIEIVQRTLAFGRGAQQGLRISPLHGPDFAFVLSGVFGDPVGVWPDSGATTMDFALGRKSNVGAAASTAIGLALFATVGVGWVSTPKRSIQGVRVVLRDLGRGTGFGAYGAHGGAMAPLAQLEPEALDWILDALDDLEAWTLFERAVFGWELPPQSLLAIDTPTFEHRVRSLLGPVDLSCFG